MSLTSPLASPAEASFRPEDKALDILFPSADDPLTDSFSQYVNEDLFDLSDGDKDFRFLGDIVDLFDKDSYTNGGSYVSPIGSSARHTQPSPQPWRKGLWCLNGKTSSKAQTDTEERNRTSLETPQKAVLTTCMAGASLGVIEQPCSSGTFGQTPPPSQPPSPPHCKTKKIVLSPRLGSTRRHPNKWLNLDRTNSLSPALETTTDQLKTIMAYQEPWHNTQQALQNFSFSPRDENPQLSPSPSGRPAPSANMTSVIQNSAVMPLSMLSSSHQYTSHDAQLVGQDYGPQGFAISPSTVPILSDSHQHPIPTWTSDTYESQGSAEIPYPMTSSELAQSSDLHPWWPQPQSHDLSDHVQNQHQSYYPLLAAPVPHRPAHTLLQHGPNLQSGGLMIQCSDQTSPEMSSPQTFSPSSFSPTTVGDFLPASVYPPPHPGQHFLQQVESFNVPRRSDQQQKHARRETPPSPSCSPTPSPSPTSTSHRDHSHSQSYSRRRNSHDRNSRRQKSSSHSTTSISKTPRTPRTPKSATASSGTIFYNLTAKHADSILKSVAPSGSSKTREKRRAQEKEKERRKSEAIELERRKAEALERKVRALVGGLDAKGTGEG